MVRKSLKLSLIAAAGLVVLGGLLFGPDLFSYAMTATSHLRHTVKDSVPVEFELERARQSLSQIVPEMHANIRLIAQEETEIASLKDDIARSDAGLSKEQAAIRKIGDMLTVQQASYSIGDRQYTHEAVKQDLSRRFDRYKECEMVLEGKRKLLTTREKSLQGAVAMLDKARSQKALLEDKIEVLAGQYRLLKAASAGSGVRLDDSKLAQTEKLIADIQKRVQVAERVLAHEGQFAETAIPVDTVNEKELLAQIGEYFGGGALPAEAAAPALAAGGGN